MTDRINIDDALLECDEIEPFLKRGISMMKNGLRATIEKIMVEGW